MVNNDLRSLWEQHLADHEPSGKSVAIWCKERFYKPYDPVKYQTDRFTWPAVALILENRLTDWQYWLKNHSI